MHDNADPKSAARPWVCVRYELIDPAGHTVLTHETPLPHIDSQYMPLELWDKIGKVPPGRYTLLPNGLPVEVRAEPNPLESEKDKDP